jgi:hypothetical protein
MPIQFSANNLPTRAVMFHDEGTAITGNTLSSVLTSIVIDTGQIHNYFTRQGPSGVADSFSNSFWLRAGTYTFSILGQTNNANGKIDWSVDGVIVVSAQDWYSAAQTKNVIMTVSVTIATDGYHKLVGTINGKNASSSGYNMDLTKYWFRQAAD